MAKNVSNLALQNKYLTAEQLNALSSENVYNYCFIDGQKQEWENDYDDEIINNLNNYPILQSLSGEPLGFIKTKIDMIMSQWIPEGKKLNPKLVYTLQSILAKNPAQVRNVALTGKANSYISKSCINLTKIINKAFEDELTVDED